MDDTDLGQLLYLGVLLGALLFYGIIAHRRHIGRAIRQLVLWALILIGIMASYGLWQDWAPRLAPIQITHGNGVIEIPKNRRGQFVLYAQINGVETEFLVDTGASNIVLSKSDAQRAGIDIDKVFYSGTAQTANGSVQTAAVEIETLNVGGVQDQGVRAYVTDGDLFGSLLGMAYLNRFEKIEITREKLILTR